jgi:glycosyltransferase involved in cell wall biosynthesis
MRIGLITHPWVPSKNSGIGNERYAYELLNGLKLRRRRVQVFHSGTSLSLVDPRIMLLSGLVKEAMITTQLIPAKADVYHALFPNGAKNPIFLRKFPLVVTILDMIPFHSDQFYSSHLNAYRRFCTLLSAEKSQKIIALFPKTKQELVSRFKIDPSKIVVIPVGVDGSHFYPRNVERTNTRRVLYVGGISRAKGIETLLRAFSIVSDQVDNVEMIVVGRITADIPQQNYIKDLLDRYGQSGKIRFVGFVPDERLPSYYSAADLAIFPSHLGFGMPTLEAMACGTPTIAGKSLDAIVLGDASVLVEPGNVEELSQTMLRVLNNEDLRKQLIRKGLEKARSLTWENTVERTLRVYEEVASA